MRSRSLSAAFNLLVVCGMLHPSLLRAQEPVASDSQAQAQPPRVLRLGPVRLPAAVALPLSAQLEVLAVIQPDGRAQLDDASVPEELTEAVRTALSQSSFQPALARGNPVPARVRVRLQLLSPQAAEVASPFEPRVEAGDTSLISAEPMAVPEPSAVAKNQEPQPILDYGASGRASMLAANVHHLELKEMRELPGAFGDPFRVLDALPGVVPALSGLPYVYVRGAPPSGTVYYYDGIQVPGMFHLALGPAVVHPTLIDEANFYPSVAPARYGRFTGGVMSGGPSPRPYPDRTHGELELRVIDLTGKIEIPVGGGSLTLSGRYGYPGPIVTLFSPKSTLDYWDYQARLSLPLSARDKFELVWLGSYDQAGFVDNRNIESDYRLEFHRAEARLIRHVGPYEVGAALQFGFERSQINNSMKVSALRVGPRVYASYRASQQLQLRVGADLFGSTGSFVRSPVIEDGLVQIRLPPFSADVAARSVMGAYAELGLQLSDRFRADLGVRADLWLTGSHPEAAADPRLSLSYRVLDSLTWHGAVGLAHQPSVFLVPLPGITEVGIEYGLQSAVQSETGVAFDLPAQFKLESQVYVQHFDNMILPELAIDQTAECYALPPDVEMATSRCNGGYPRSSAWAYGLEVFLRRALSEDFSGWINYTLGWARAQSATGLKFNPTFDVRHVLNLVLQYKLGRGFSTGARLQYRSGKNASHIFIREAEIPYQQRLAGFFRADANISYGWHPSWGSLRVTLEWFNLTLSREESSIDCDKTDDITSGRDPLKTAVPCPVKRAPALFFPNLGIRAEY
ncbi:MAG TPA: TonB-dependent receptor [Polyangiales bacterium]|nr:TonB-dependent receptor [Polyangiales bacterium]